MFSGAPHLHAAHWSTSSVVPTKLPLTLRIASFRLVPRVWLNRVLAGLISLAGRTRDAHALPPTKVAPGALILNLRSRNAGSAGVMATGVDHRPKREPSQTLTRTRVLTGRRPASFADVLVVVAARVHCPPLTEIWTR